MELYLHQWRIWGGGGGGGGGSEVSTETPFCSDCIIAHISKTRAQLTYCRFHASLRPVVRALALTRYYLRKPSAYAAIIDAKSTVAEKGHPILPFYAHFHLSILLFCYPSMLPYFHPSISATCCLLRMRIFIDHSPM